MGSRIRRISPAIHFWHFGSDSAHSRALVLEKSFKNPKSDPNGSLWIWRVLIHSVTYCSCPQGSDIRSKLQISWSLANPRSRGAVHLDGRTATQDGRIERAHRDVHPGRPHWTATQGRPHRTATLDGHPGRPHRDGRPGRPHWSPKMVTQDDRTFESFFAGDGVIWEHRILQMASANPQKWMQNGVTESPKWLFLELSSRDKV